MKIPARCRLPVMTGLILAGCTDAAMITAPEPAPHRSIEYGASYDGSVPYLSDPDVPESWRPIIHSISPVVYWEGSTAVGSSRVAYVGNRIEAELTLVISGPVSNVSMIARSSDVHFLPEYRTHTTPGFRLSATADCGHVANLTAHYLAKTTIFFNWNGFTSLEVARTGGVGAQQPKCPEEREVDAPAPQPGGGGSGGGGTEGCPECLDEPATGYTMCRVRYWYYVDTGEITDYVILYCW